jgi:hypothetical protein
MKKKENYMTLFLAYCRKHEIWFSVNTTGQLMDCTYLKDGNAIDFSPELGYEVGSKICYDYMKMKVAEILKEIG